MNKNNILIKLNKIANILDNNNLHVYSNSITDIMTKIAQSEFSEVDNQIIDTVTEYLKSTNLNTENIDLKSMVRDSLEELKARINRLSSDVDLLDDKNF